MNIKVVEYSIFVSSMIYMICVCRDLRHTNDLQDTALEEVNESLSLLIKNNIDSHQNNIDNDIESENDKVDNVRVEKKDEVPHQDTMKEGHDSVSRKATHKNISYDKPRYGRDVSLIPKYDDRKSFDAEHKIKNSKKKTMKKIWAEKQSFPKKSRKEMRNQKSTHLDGLKKLKQNKKQDLQQERNKQLYKNMESRKLMDNLPNESTTTTTLCTLIRASFPDFGYDFDFADTLQHSDQNNKTSSASFNFSVDVMTDDYAYDVAMGWTLFQKGSYDSIIDSDEEDFTSKFYANLTHVFEYYCVVSYGDGKMNESINDDMVPTCFDFVVHNSQKDELQTIFGSAINVTMTINNKEKATLTNPNKDTSSMGASFCLDSIDNVFNHEPFNKVIFLDYEYNRDTDMEKMNVDTRSSDAIPKDKNDLYNTICVLTKAEIIPPCDDFENAPCIDYVSRGKCTDTSIASSDYYYGENTWQEIMLQLCQKSCNACLPPVSLLDDYKVQYEEYENTITSFNLSLDMNTDTWAYETSWLFTSSDSEDHVIFNSSELHTTSQLENNAEYKFNYNCTMTQNEENQLIHYDAGTSTCYNFEAHDSYGDGGGFFSMSLNTMNSTPFVVSNEFEDGSVMSTSFCLDIDDGMIETEGRFIIEEEVSEEPTSSPYPTNQPSPVEIHQTSCVLTKADILSPCDDEYGYFYCSHFAEVGYCADTSSHYKYEETTWKDYMLTVCQKSCGACPNLFPFENQILHSNNESTITTFNLSLDFHTDSYANETSWLFFSQDREDFIFNSKEAITTTKLVNNQQHVIQYNCIISHAGEKDNLFSGDEIPTSTCYDFEVHDLSGDGMCCEYGDGSFSMNINTNSSTLQVKENFKHGSVISTFFCIEHNDGKIRSNGKLTSTEQPSHYPFQWQCKNGFCLCDSKPDISASALENHVFLFEVTMLSDSNKLKDVESAQHKAACWVLHDDPYEYYGLADEIVHKKMIQRYILAVLYFSMSPEKWKDHTDFLSSRSECDWKYIDEYNDYDGGVSCNKDGSVIKVDLYRNNLDGTIIDELFGLRMLEVLNLRENKIHRTLPPTLGRLVNLRDLDLSKNDLEGTVPPQLFHATNLEFIYLQANGLEGTIPKTIAYLQKLSLLWLSGNNLSGSIPDVIHSLYRLENLDLSGNKISSSIPPMIGKLNKLKQFDLQSNRLSGSIPSTIGNMTSLAELFLNNNSLSGSIPESLYYLPDMNILSLKDNNISGSIPDNFCERLYFVEVDCRNNVFDPRVSCSCCLCKDDSPVWDGECADSSIKVEIDHGYFFSGSNDLEWSLTNDATGTKILFGGPHLGELGFKTYKSCVAHSDCFSFNQISPPTRNTNYRIFLNNKSIYFGKFLGYDDNLDISQDHPPQTSLSFSYDEENQQVSSCYDIKLKCYEEEQPLLLEVNTMERIMYDQAIKTSGRLIIHDTSSPQSKALCWLVNNDHDHSNRDVSHTEFEQRYILAILHFMSPDGLFGGDKHPPNKHECEWNGITCRDSNTNIVTDISLSSENNQIISGTLIDELGSLKYLKVLELNQTQLHGTIPQSFSNLWSLMKLDLSGNKINSTMPDTLFHQLKKLEHIDLSNNELSGSINDDIGSFSHIRTLLLKKNKFTGSLPLESFEHYDLEHLDISENELSQIDFLPLLKHKNLKSFDVSNNFFAGSLHEYTFTSLTQLQYINISQNDFSGTIPTTFPKMSDITQLDLHANKLRGPIPLGITELRNIQHLNLQGNKLTGSLPSELNQLQSLTTLVLSHNELKGSIPFNQTNLQEMERLHLHSNKLEGEAPLFSNLNSYITDCGFPSDSLDPVTCSTCNTCCNSDGGCQSKTTEELNQVYKTLIFMSSIIGFIIICYALKDIITSNKYLKSFFEEKVKDWNALMLINDKSVYHFLLIDNKIEWYVAIVCGIFQTATLFLFVHSADMMNDTSDREYFKLCPANSLECEDLNNVSAYGIFIFGLILTIWLLRDIIGSVKLMLVSFEKKNKDYFFTSAVVFSVTMLSLWTSIIYIDAIAAKNTDMIKDAVVLLFVLQIDERIFQLIESVNPDWV